MYSPTTVGDVIRWNQPCHLKHSLTEKYLAVDPTSGKLTTVSNRNDPNSVFKFYSVVQESEFVTSGAFCRCVQYQHTSKFNDPRSNI